MLFILSSCSVMNRIVSVWYWLDVVPGVADPAHTRPSWRASGSQMGNGSQVHRFRGHWETHTHRTHSDTLDHTPDPPFPSLRIQESRMKQAIENQLSVKQKDAFKLSEKLWASWSENRKWRWACEKCCGYTATHTHTHNRVEKMCACMSG